MADSRAHPGPLSGIKVLDFTRFQNGPMATLLLADYGAEVRAGSDATKTLARSASFKTMKWRDFAKTLVTDWASVELAIDVIWN